MGLQYIKPIKKIGGSVASPYLLIPKSLSPGHN